jgi:glycosyltransferase involved in cell wall biosynthesis
MEDPTIDILLPTYNGEKFIKEQIESVLNQSYENWRLLVRDDGSSDNTIEMVRDYATKYPQKIIFIEDDKSHLGACLSFAQLLNHSTSDYIMFCDQDDIWQTDKIEITLKKMLELEKTYDHPILVHTDVKVVDENLNILRDSFWRYQRVNPDLKSLNHLLIQNNVTGCAMMINQRLKEISLPIPTEAIMYDWWIGLVASTFGVIEYIKKPTAHYRQHTQCDTGAKKYTTWFFLSKINRLNEPLESIRKAVRQGKAFKERFKDQLSEEQLGIVGDFTNLLQVNRFKRLRLLAIHNIRKYGTLRNIGFFILMLLYNRGRNE